jgi:RNA polymerase sigma-70 factor (ECF subfamily)
MVQQPLRVEPDCRSEGDGPRSDDWSQIASGCRRHDQRSFERLVQLTQQRLRRLVGRIAGSRADLDELVQETYLRAWCSVGRFRGDSGLLTWLTRIAVNVAINWRRDHRPIVSLADETERMPAAPSIDDQALHEAFERAISRLAPELRATFVLHENEGLSYREIAETLDCPIGTVMSRLHRAREQLIAQLRERLDELVP